MEMQLQELIEQIKKNGVEVAEAEAAAILATAKSEAEKIISDARREAEKIMLAAQNENDRVVRTAEDSIRQAGRNMLLSFRESVTKELESVIGEEVKRVYSPENLSNLILAVVEAWARDNDTESLAVLLNAEDLTRMETNLLAALKKKMISGVTLKPNDNFDGGFRISVNDGRAYYDYSAAAIVEMLSSYLSPRVTALMKEAEGV